jgi:hypothetical protein
MSAIVEKAAAGIFLVFVKRERDGRGGPAIPKTVRVPISDEEAEELAFDLLSAKQLRKAAV